MNDSIVAGELTKIARILNADHGDIPIYFNVSDYVKIPNRGMLDAETTRKAQAILSKSVFDIVEKLDDEVKKSLSKYKNELEEIGLTMK